MRKTMMAGLAGALTLSVAAAAMAAVPAPEFVKKAAASDLYEEQSSKLVLTSTKNPKIRQFANQMIADHMKTTMGVKTAVKANGMMPKPPMLEPKQADMMAKLRAASGTQRDQLYIEQQKMSHDEALALMTDYSANGDNAALKKAAMTAVPIVQRHVGELAAM